MTAAMIPEIRETNLTKYLATRPEKISPEKIEQLQALVIERKFFDFNELVLAKEIENSTIDYMDVEMMARYCLDGYRGYILADEAVQNNLVYGRSVLNSILTGKKIDEMDKQYFLPDSRAKSPLDTLARTFSSQLEHLEFFSAMTEQLAREYVQGNKICLIMHDEHNKPTFNYYKNDAALTQEIIRGCGLELKTTLSLEQTGDKANVGGNSKAR